MGRCRSAADAVWFLTGHGPIAFETSGQGIRQLEQAVLVSPFCRYRAILSIVP